jgi:hypothetical protein
MEKAKGTFRGIIISAAKIEIFPDHLTATDASITTCDLESPHYSVTAKKIDLLVVRTKTGAAPEELKIKGAGLRFGGHKLFSLPPFQLSLAADTKQTLPLPYPGYSRQDGPFIGYNWKNGTPQDRPNYELSLRMTRKRGVRGALYTRYPLRTLDFAELTFSHREDLRDHPSDPRQIDTNLSKVLVSRLPELALHTAPRPIGNSF